ncbi:GNAT family N-acetyltransferase [Streptomyces montanisoli]|uniref:GNAT family N-acetyltransferase n=1 Tax=Streptomyces montanisoli TaxID=2798581 RepID=A0A940RX47_9ACTN|nr:GNAT family N-acetyltransferase [Streptomyces montanisoli]MBP0460822.1 GNAT family N-acetyltransferase [Streptomyces montanisoli]
MTTTLRPTGPLTETPDGVRNRAYQVCVNGRPVGAAELGTDPAFGPTAGVVLALRIDEPDRGRGRGTVAALAAEEVLRGWGCHQVLASVPAGRPAALRLLDALGYAERGRTMVKTLPETAPGLPDGIGERAMTDEEFTRWSAASSAEFVRNWVSRGMTHEQARAKAGASLRQNLPDGLATPGVAFRLLLAGGESVGRVWVARQEVEPGRPGGYVYEVRVDEDSRGRGYGRALMLLAERVSLGWGATGLGLHVFSDNTVAVRLYASLGYEVTVRHFGKPLL